MRYSLIFILILLNFHCKSSYKTGEEVVKPDAAGFVEFSDFGFRDKPILNREYLIFLCWYESVFGDSYPEKLLTMLPPNSMTMQTEDLNLLPRILDEKSLFKSYILNPKFWDYPVTGLTTNQIMECQKWMHDRYHEALLIKLGHFNFNMEQKDEDNFVLESFYIGQYQGNVRKNLHKLSELEEQMPLDWNEYNFKTVFRLPYKKELEKINTTIPSTPKMKAYSFGKKDFLWAWNEYFMEAPTKAKETSLNRIFGFASNHPIPIFEDIEEDFIAKDNPLYADVQPLILDFETRPTYPYPEKNEFGAMYFVIVDTDETGHPLVGNPLPINNNIKSENRVYRICYKI